jgi:hypothetical protein
VRRGDLFQGFSGEASDSLNFVVQGIQQRWYGLGKVVAERAQLRTVCGFDPCEVFRVRAQEAGFLMMDELQGLQEETVFTRDFCKENLDRIETASEEMKWLEQRGIMPVEYRRTLRATAANGLWR